MTGNEEGNIPGFHIAAFLDFLTVFCGQDGMYVDLHQFIHEGLAVREESPMAKTKIRQATGSRPATLSRSSRESIAAASWTVCSNSDLMDETIAADDPGIPNGRDNILTDTSCCLALSEYSRRPAAKARQLSYPHFRTTRNTVAGDTKTSAAMSPRVMPAAFHGWFFK